MTVLVSRTTQNVGKRGDDDVNRNKDKDRLQPVRDGRNGVVRSKTRAVDLLVFSTCG